MYVNPYVRTWLAVPSYAPTFDPIRVRGHGAIESGAPYGARFNTHGPIGSSLCIYIAAESLGLHDQPVWIRIKDYDNTKVYRGFDIMCAGFGRICYGRLV